MRSRRRAKAIAHDGPRLPFELAPRADRDAVLVIAHPPLRERIAEHAQEKGFTVRVETSGLAAIQLLAQQGDHIAYAILSSDEDWVVGLRQVLAEQYPAIRCLMLIA